jgi:Tol biopolymer transport system component
MPTMTAKSTLLLLLAGAAACAGDQDPMAPDAGAVTASPVTESPAAPELLTAGTGPRILFSSARSGGLDIYRMAPDGTGVVRLTSFSGPEVSPAWSWDNNRIALVRDRLYGSSAIHHDIYLMNADGTGKKWARSSATDYDVTDPSWSKDGTRLAVTVWLGEARGGLPGTPYLATMTVANGNMGFVLSAGTVLVAFTPSFDPTGKKIAYSGEDGLSLEMVNADGTGHKTLVQATRVGGIPTGNFASPVFSPDGKRIAYAKSNASNWDIYVMSLVDGTTKRLTTNAAPDMHPTWSADGSKIAFTSSRSGAVQVWTVPSNGGTQVRITNTSVTEQTPAWSH